MPNRSISMAVSYNRSAIASLLSPHTGRITLCHPCKHFFIQARMQGSCEFKINMHCIPARTVTAVGIVLTVDFSLYPWIN